LGAAYLSHHEAYFQNLKAQFDKVYDLASQARAKGLDPSLQPEPLVTYDVAERVEKGVGPRGVAARIRELTSLMPRELVALKIAEEISLGSYGINGEEAAEQAVRTASGILDEGVTAAPIEGISSVRIRSNQDGSKYLAVYFAGPIRSAGGTDMALILVIADYVRHQLGLGRYKATELEAKRFVEELRLYEREVARFQFKVSDDELFNAIMRLPVEVNGVETDPVEVSAYRNIPRVETNRVRGGALRVVHDGLIGRSHKVLKIVDNLSIEGWNWLREIKPPVAEAEEAREFMFMEDVLGGRPIFSFPQHQGGEGGFRLRYGRARNTGLAAVGLHPSTMIVLGKFIAVGTQIRIEKPGKAGVATSVESIEPPVVKLKDGSVLKLSDPAQAEKVLDSIDKVLFLGDILIGVGEFLENNRSLLPSGLVEEWWTELLKLEAVTKYDGMDGFAQHVGLTANQILVYTDPYKPPTADEALLLAKKSEVPLHPKYTWFWENIGPDDFDYLRAKLATSSTLGGSTERIVMQNDLRTKDILERLCVPHIVQEGVIIIEDDAPVLCACLGAPSPNPNVEGKDVFEKIANVSGMRVMKKAPVYVGARMGRPEKAKRREMRPIVHCLFPIGLAGGSRRSITEAAAGRSLVPVDIAYKKCPSCGDSTFGQRCEKCGERTVQAFVCARCGADSSEQTCPKCHAPTQAYSQRNLPLRDILHSATTRLSMTTIPESVKGVRGLTNETRTPEPLEKGLLRAKYDISMFKDGTTRFDATNAPLTHFKPAEIGVEIEKLHEMGYLFDYSGAPLESKDQCCYLNIHDIIVPEECGDYFVAVSKFLDELLQRYYSLPPFYRAKNRRDLIGQLVVGLSPHTSVGVIGRIVGYTKAKVCFAHPFWHSAKRRDCDGDEDSVSLALDMLLNFSKQFLPSRIGGIMDAPILLTVAIKPDEIARQAFNVETVERLPLRFFDETLHRSDAKTLIGLVETVHERLGTASVLDSLGFTQMIQDINYGNLESAYKKLGSMLDKVTAQLSLAESIRAVDAAEVAKRVLSTHFMRDLTGNLRAFTGQRFRCTKCNSKFRRIPLKGACTRCGGPLSLTVYRGGIEKYLDVAEDLVKRYKLGTYHEQRLILLRDEIGSLFSEPEERKNQPTLAQFV
jgi:DNA polymerase II large subunit